MTYRLTTIAMLLALCASLYFVNSASHAAPAAQAWEYKVILKKCNDEKTLNALGADGWELATYAVWPVGMSSVDTCVFKRAK